MDEGRSARRVADGVESQFYDRCPPFKRPQHLRPPKYRSAPPVTAAGSDEHVSTAKPEEPKKKYSMSLLGALHSGASSLLLLAVLIIRSILLEDMDLRRVARHCGHAQHDHSCVPALASGLACIHYLAALVSKLLIAYITTAYVAHKAGPEAVDAGLVATPRPVGYGIGMAFAIFAMQETASICNGMFFYFRCVVHMMSAGVNRPA